MMVNLASIQPLPETEEWKSVPRLEDGMWPTGGVVDPEADSGLMNWQAQILAGRTRFLRTRVDALIAAVVAASTTVAGIVRLNNTLTSSAVDEALTAAQGKALQTTKAPLASPAFTGTPTAPTAAVATNTTQIATTAFVQAKVAALVNASPAALDTLYELAAALGNDPNFATTVTNAIAQKAPLASPGFTGAPTAPTPAAGENSPQIATTEWVRQNVLPAGCVAAFAMTAAPPGWLRCNGAAVSRDAYAGLFAAIGTSFGPGDGATTFNLPEARGEFIRGLDDGRGVDAGRVLGSTQGAESNRLLQVQSARNPPGEQGNVTIDIPATDVFSPWVASGRSMDGDDVNMRFRSSGAEARPRNLALLYCIKF
ncbi:hypothetical protein C5F48_23175 [Cereibacter changlensis JA139]|uniref:Phage tail collar domain-containing protein n=2 Tax=Cereibacter changlensis TaxID=402884 RepID=A0A2T4JNC6_9RHOB|nr:phage tail protein [Cereibacter changlensis]PTE19391.1 hypothetical protein C5F48_23175 [Cereibacter changlensis JA139]